MELKELTEWLLDLLGIRDVKEIPETLMKVVKENDASKYEKFSEKLPDMSTDWLQKVYQYYLADRKEKMQDYTHKSLARFVSRLAGESDAVIDMCAGSGALAIQRWNITPDQEFCLYEFDANVIPLLLFNMAVRNINCTVYHADVLQNEIYHIYIVSKSNQYGQVKEIEK